MRPVLHGDVSCAARALYAAAPEGRAALCRRMLRAAELADKHRKSTGRLHPRWGNGALMAAARQHTMADEPGFDDAEYRACFIMVLQALGAPAVSRRRSPRSG